MGVPKPEGEKCRVGVVPWLVTEAARDGFRECEPLDGVARRERVLRTADFFLWGWARLLGSKGSWGSLILGWASWSFWWRSAISWEVRVRVRLWVGAVERGVQLEGCFKERCEDGYQR